MPKSSPQEKFYTTDEAAEYLRVTPSRVRQLIGEERLKAEKLGRDHLIMAEQLAEYVTKGKKKRGRQRNVSK
jgi:excisionase family DNA binding protein